MRGTGRERPMISALPLATKGTGAAQFRQASELQV